MRRIFENGEFLKPVPFENRVFALRILNLGELGAICVSSIMEAVSRDFKNILYSSSLSMRLRHIKENTVSC
jgi:hypothetical protein